MFFKRNYSIPGPGIDPDEPEKFGFARFCQILTLECRTILRLNFTTFFASLPILTIPPALCAMNAVIRKMELDQPVDCGRDFRHAFASFWKQSYVIFLLGTVLPLFTGVASFFYARTAAQNPLYFVPCVLSLFVFAASALASPYLYAMSATDFSLKALIRRAVLVGIAKPLRSFLCLLVNIGMMFLTLWFFPLSFPYFVLIGLSVPCLVGQFFIRLNLRRFALKRKDESELSENQRTAS